MAFKEIGDQLSGLPDKIGIWVDKVAHDKDKHLRRTLLVGAAITGIGLLLSAFALATNGVFTGGTLELSMGTIIPLALGMGLGSLGIVFIVHRLVLQRLIDKDPTGKRAKIIAKVAKITAGVLFVSGAAFMLASVFGPGMVAGLTSGSGLGAGALFTASLGLGVYGLKCMVTSKSGKDKITGFYRSPVAQKNRTLTERVHRAARKPKGYTLQMSAKPYTH